MTADQIIQFIQAPEKLDPKTLPLLKELTEQYPAFEAGWILYLKNLKNLNDSSFAQELVYAAPRIHDRQKLYLLLNSRAPESKEEVMPQPDAGEGLDIFQMIFQPDYRLETSPDQETAANETEKPIQKETEKKMKLIEKFLEAQPQMPPIKESTPVSPTHSPKQTEEDPEDFVTETLAVIYSQQGYYKRAIQIFEKLSLKYPEKSAYFADRIEKIKILMNN